MIIHIVKENDTVNSIAAEYGVSAERVVFDNQLYIPDRLITGQALLILIPEIIHTVRANETIEVVAFTYGVSAKDIMRNNPYLIERNYLLEGERIIIRYTSNKLRKVNINGYVYPHVDWDILMEQLLYLSNISIFSYGFTQTGELTPIDDEALIYEALQFQVRPLFVLAPITEGRFNSDLISAAVNNMDVQQTLIDNIINMVREKQYSGVNVDFEYIKAEDRDAYSAFIENLTLILNGQGIPVSVALVPKVSDEQRGLLYEGMDYARLGAAANSVMIMTYEWGYTYGPPMAVAPLNKVKDVLDYAVSRIESSKIDLGIPNYGYDWELPFERGVTVARSIGNVEALEIAAANNVAIEFDETAQTPFFYYSENGVEHVVWFEDVRSINQKLHLINDYSLRGAGYWQLMRSFRQNWLTLNSLYEIN